MLNARALMLDAIRTLVAADSALFLEWRNDDEAWAPDASAETSPVRTVRISRVPLLLHDGVILDREQAQQLFGSAFGVWFPTHASAAYICFAPVVSAHEKSSSALLFVWRDRSAAVTERLAELRPLFGALLEAGVRDAGSQPVASVARNLSGILTGLMKQLLSFSSQLLAEPSLFNVDDLLRKIEPLLADALVAPGSLVVEPDAIDARVLMDERQLALALMNLLATACECMGSGTVITVRSARITIATGATLEVEHADRWVAIALSDSAKRIPATVRDNLQESFVGIGTDRGRPGLGLETIAALVQQAGGTIRCTVSESTGCTFTLYLPEADTRPLASSQLVAAGEVRIASDYSELPILVVDDDAGPRRVVRRLLEREGHQVLTAESAAEGLTQLEIYDGGLSCVISDYLMPGKSGMELLVHIRTHWPQLPVVLVSGFTSDDVTGTALQELRAHFLPKPFTREELLNAIQTAKLVCREQ